MPRNLPHRVNVTSRVWVSDGMGGGYWQDGAPVPYPALVALLDADEQGNVYDTERASIRLPHAAQVADGNLVTVTQPEGLAGDWQATSVRWNRDHVRVIAVRPS